MHHFAIANATGETLHGNGLARLWHEILLLVTASEAGNMSAKCAMLNIEIFHVSFTEYAICFVILGFYRLF